MNEKPLLFKTALVNAIIAGTKTQTRRIVDNPEQLEWDDKGKFSFSHAPDCGGYCDYACACEGEVLDGHIGWTPWGTSPGERASIWVRESFLPCTGTGDRHPIAISKATYVCFPDGSQKFKTGKYWQQPATMRPPNANSWPQGAKWRPSIHLPRWASRITLEITGIRCQQLKDISRGDAMAEGCPFPNLNGEEVGKTDPVGWFRDKWNEINGAIHPWKSNPWVWVIDFKVKS